MWAAVLAVVIMSGRSGPEGGVAYPGVAPGKTECQVSLDSIRLGNRAIQAVWELSARGLRPKSVADVQGRRTLTLRGEAFVIVIEDGSEYRASDLTLQGRPRVIDPTPRRERSQQNAVRGKRVPSGRHRR